MFMCDRSNSWCSWLRGGTGNVLDFNFQILYKTNKFKFLNIKHKIGMTLSRLNFLFVVVRSFLIFSVWVTKDDFFLLLWLFHKEIMLKVRTGSRDESITAYARCSVRLYQECLSFDWNSIITLDRRWCWHSMCNNTWCERIKIRRPRIHQCMPRRYHHDPLEKMK